MKRLWIVLATIFIANIHAVSQVYTPLWKTLPEVPPMPAPDESGLAPVNDIKMYYAVFNKKGSDPVIMLHGGFVSSDDWGFEVPLLLKTHKVIVVDSRGHGRSSMGSQPLGYDLMTSDVVKLLDYLGIRRVSVVGWSDGGIIGLILAIKYPDRVNKLFTYGTNYNLTGYKREPFDSALAAHFMARVKENYHKLSSTPNDFGNLRSALGKMYSSEPDIKAEELKTIRAPTVIAGGQYEQFIKLEHFEELAHLIPNAKLVIIPNVSHGGPIQDPAQFHHAVAALLDNK